MLRLPTRCLVVLIGPSSAGKSTWATQHFRPEQVVASDDLRAAVGESRHDQRAGKDAFDLLERVVAARLGRRLLTVVDTMGLQADRRAAWVQQAHRHRMPAIAVVFDTPAAEVRSRNAARTPRIPAGGLSRQIRTAEVTTDDLLLSEGFDRVVLYRRSDYDWNVLGERRFPLDPTRYHHLLAQVEGDAIRCYCDGELIAQQDQNDRGRDDRVRHPAHRGRARAFPHR